MNNQMLHYKVYAEKNHQISHTKPVIVFIHCIAVHSALFVKQIRYLKKKYDLVLIDLPSHGKSEIRLSELENSYGAIADEILKILNFLEIEKAHFVGCSLGTFILKYLLVNHSEKIEKSIMIGCIGNYQLFHNFCIRMALILINILPFKHFCYILATGFLPSKYSKEAKKIALACCKYLQKYELKSYLKLFTKFPEVNRAYIQKLSEFELDTDNLLYISGDKEKLFIPTLKEELKYIKNFRVINHCGHLGNFDQPDKVNRLIDKFISKKEK